MPLLIRPGKEALLFKEPEEEPDVSKHLEVDLHVEEEVDRLLVEGAVDHFVQAAIIWASSLGPQSTIDTHLLTALGRQSR